MTGKIDANMRLTFPVFYMLISDIAIATTTSIIPNTHLKRQSIND